MWRLSILFLLAKGSFTTNEYENVFLQQRPQIEQHYQNFQISIEEAAKKLPRIPPEILNRAMFNPKIKELYDNLDALQEQCINTIMAPLCDQYSWGIPNDQAIKALIEQGPLVEVGAGRGYWAHLISEQGGDIVAYDNFSWNSVNVPNKWHTVHRGTPEILSQHEDRALLLCWPPRDDMAFEALKYFKGQRLIYVGEAIGGAMADRQFFKLLEAQFTEVKSIEIPTWPGYSDKLYIYSRKI